MVDSQDFHAGYDAGRAACLTLGQAKALMLYDTQFVNRNSAYREGWSWALWDYEDANGLPHDAAGAE